MFGVAFASFAAVVLLWLVGMRRRGSGVASTASDGRRWLVGGGLLLPGVAVTALLVFGSPSAMHQLPALRATDDGAVLQVQAIGRQWAWEIRYPQHGVSLENELRIPVGRPVEVVTSSRDVIHSFWVPRLGGKLDAIPGRHLRLRLQAEVAGSFRGQCAEFCGLGHAHMAMTVHAMTPAAFEGWLAERGK